MNVVFDLDGTLIDARPRLYALYRRLVPATELDFEGYWTIKRAKVPHEVLLRQREGFAPQDVAEFLVEWMALIETPDLLELDAVFPGIPETLARLAQQAHLHVCTARQLRQPVLHQLERFGVSRYFRSVMVTQQVHSKLELVSALAPAQSPNDWMIGDTGSDIEAGKRLGMRTCAVLSGFLDRERLLPYGPDLVLRTAADFTLPKAPTSRIA